MNHTTRGGDDEFLDAIAVGAVRGLSAKPVVVVDLLLNWASGASESLKVVRLRSDTFDPRSLVSETVAPRESMQLFLAKLLEESSATPLPDIAAANGKPFAQFESLDEYHRAVLSVSVSD